MRERNVSRLCMSLLVLAGFPWTVTAATPLCPDGTSAEPGAFVDPIARIARQDVIVALGGQHYRPVRCVAGGETVCHRWVAQGGVPVDDAETIDALFTTVILLEGMEPDTLDERADQYARRARRLRQDEATFREISRDATILDVASEVFTTYLSAGTDPSAFWDLGLFTKVGESLARMMTLYGVDGLETPQALDAAVTAARRALAAEALRGGVATTIDNVRSLQKIGKMLDERAALMSALASEKDFYRRVQLRASLDRITGELEASASALGWSLFTTLENTSEVAENSAEFAMLNRTAYAYNEMIAGVYRRAARGRLSSGDEVAALAVMIPTSIDMRIDLLERYRDEYRARTDSISGAMWDGAARLTGSDVVGEADKAILMNHDLRAMEQSTIRRALVAIELESTAHQWALAEIETVRSSDTTPEMDPEQLVDATFEAAFQGDVQRLIELHDSGADLDVANTDGNTPLTILVDKAASGQGVTINGVKDMLVAGADPNLGAPICEAVSECSLDLVRLLLDHGADPNVIACWGFETHTPLEEAVSSCREQQEVITALLDAGADPDLHGQENAILTEILGMYDEEDLGLVNLLLAHGADPDTPCYGTTPLFWAMNMEDPELVRTILSHGPDATIPPEGAAEMMPFVTDEDLANQLLDRGFPATAEAAMAAVDQCRPEVVEAFLDRGVTLDGIESWRLMNLCDPVAAVLSPTGEIPPDTMVQRGCERGDFNLVVRGLRRGGRADTLPNGGGECLQKALEAHDDQATRMLLEGGADWVWVDGLLSTIACSGQGWMSEPAQIALLEAAFDAGAMLVAGHEDPAVCAARQGRTDLLHLLSDRGLYTDAPGEDGLTPLMTAANAGKADAARLLLDLGAAVNRTDNRGATALDHALRAVSQGTFGADRTRDLLVARGGTRGSRMIPIEQVQERVDQKAVATLDRMKNDLEASAQARRDAEARAAAEAQQRARQQAEMQARAAWEARMRHEAAMAAQARDAAARRRQQNRSASPSPGSSGCVEGPAPPLASLFPKQVKGATGHRRSGGAQSLVFTYERTKNEPVMTLEIFSSGGGPRTREEVRSAYLKRGARLIDVGGWPVAAEGGGSRYSTNKGSFAIAVTVHDGSPAARRALAKAALLEVLNRIPRPCP